MHLHLCWSEGEPQPGRERLWFPALAPLCESRGEGRLLPAESSPMCVPPWHAELRGWYPGCWLGNGMEQPAFLGTFSLHCAAPSQHFTNHHKEDDKKGGKALFQMNSVCPFPGHPNCLGRLRGARQSWSLLAVTLHNFMIIWGSLHDGIIRAQGGKSGLVPSSAPKPVCFGMTYLGCPIGTNIVLSICCLCYFQGFLRLKSKH